MKKIKNTSAAGKNTEEKRSQLNHDIKSSLTSIKAYAQLLKRRVNKKDDEKNYHFLEQLDRQVDALTMMIGKVLEKHR